MSRRGQPWTDSDVACAEFLRHCGMTNEEIGKTLHRSTGSVKGKIGYQRHRKYVVIWTPPARRLERRT